MEIICIEKYHWTHDQFMKTPKATIDLLMVKRGTDAEEQKRFNSKK